MVAIDNTHDMPARRGIDYSGHTGWLVLFALLGSVLLATATQAFYADIAGGWTMAAQMVTRFALLLFVAAMSVEALARLVPIRSMATLGRERAGLVLAFAVSFAVSLLCVATGAYRGGDALSAPALAYCVLTGLILAVMLVSAHPATAALMGGPAARALQRIATAYFWLVLVITGLDHIVGPHRPDAWYGFSLLLLTATLLLRFADTFVAHWRGLAGKAG
ncbi:MAG TPA: hypothetical protein VGC36_07235 [Rhizomicrobium sp.]